MIWLMLIPAYFLGTFPSAVMIARSKGVDITKVGSQAWTVGAKVYWDDTNKRTTTVATDNTLIGVAVEAVASGASDTIGRVRLNAAF